jgi:hypothetical protein
LNKYWDIRFDELWADIVALAEDVWTTAAGPSQGFQRNWHHFLMAVGNFKRQTPVFVPGPRINALNQGAPVVGRTQLVVPVGIGFYTLVQGANAQPATTYWPTTNWAAWTAHVHGFGTPTATTALSALWPGSHVIVDVRDLRATIGLLVANGSNVVPGNSNQGVDTDWDEYGWFRQLLVEEAVRLEVTLLELERALFLGDQLVPRAFGTRSWTAYGAALRQAIAARCPCD